MSDDEGDFRRALPGYAEPIPNDLLVSIGRLLYGEDFAPPLAKALNVSTRTVLRWRSGDARVTPRIVPELLQLLEDHSAAVSAAKRRLRTLLPPPAPAQADQTQPRD